MSRRLALCALLLLVAVGACSTGSSTAGSTSGRISVVAAEDFWGSIAAQLGGDRVDLKSLITNPDTDPHDYEPTPADARAIATAGYVISNGLGYDAWIDKLLAANPASGRTTLNIGDHLGLKIGDNPHRWYSPGDVQTVIDQITADYKQLRPADAAYFDQQRATFETTALGPYKAVIAEIKARFTGTPIGASESIVTPLAAALGLRVVTPETFLDAISEGSDPSAADKALVDQQLATKAIKVFVFNAQNATPDVQRLVDLARANGIAVTTVTETLTPQGTTFQDWQTRQLQELEAALSTATGT
jgi:zinc/manganese transport system substrate-binding protein